MARLTYGLLAAVFVATAVAGFFGVNMWYASRGAHPGDSAAQTLARLLTPDAKTLFGKDRLSVLVLGIDYNYDDKDQPFSKGARSDTIMAVSLDLAGTTVHELSVPRDMDVVLPNGQEEKINAAYAQGGPSEAKAVVAKFLGLSGFDRYVVLRVDAARDLIDALGGVDVDVRNADALRHAGANGPIDYDDSWGHLHVHLKPGPQHLTGTAAMGYARFRHDWCSDPCRIERQQQVVHAIVQRLGHDRLNTLTHLQPLLATIKKDVDTDLSATEQLSLAAAYAGVSTAAIRTAQVPYRTSKDLPLAGNVLVADETVKAQLVAAAFGPGQSPAGAPPSSAPAPNGIHVTVENGSGERGLAAKVAQALTMRGYVIDDIRDAGSFGYARTIVLATSERRTVGDRVRGELRLPADELQIAPAALTAPVSDVTVIVGRDYSTR
jgi:LCP family protein required for cell wall assembly